MGTEIDHDVLDDALRRCGSSWDAAQTHGLLTGRLAVAGSGGGLSWLQQVLEGTNATDALRVECERLLKAIFERTHRQLSERLSEFSPLLPSDSDSPEARAAALGHWCEGYLHGLVSTEHGEGLKEKLGQDPLADIIRDMLQITRAAVDENDDEESNESAYAELVEYLRVAAQLTFEELAEFRYAGAAAHPEKPETLH
jgi:yecA family protein